MSPVVRFFVFVYALTWACFFAAVVISQHSTPAHTSISLVRGFLLLLGTFAPAIVALLMTSTEKGRAGVATLLKGLLRWRVGLRWYVFAVTYMAAIKFSVALLHRAITGTWPPFGHELPVVILIAIVISTPFQSGEEIGWRGYALPRMAARMGFGWASVLLGVIWAFWHLPLFFLAGADKYGQSFPVFVLGVTALSVAIAWLYVHANGSLLLTMLMHSAVNQTIGIVPDASPNAHGVLSMSISLPFFLSTLLLCISAAYLLVRMPKARSLITGEPKLAVD